MRDPSKNQLTSVTQGLALTIHSKYMSIPSVIACGSMRAPRTIRTRGISVRNACETRESRAQSKKRNKKQRNTRRRSDRNQSLVNDEMKKKEAEEKRDGQTSQAKMKIGKIDGIRGTSSASAGVKGKESGMRGNGRDREREKRDRDNTVMAIIVAVKMRIHGVKEMDFDPLLLLR